MRSAYLAPFVLVGAASSVQAEPYRARAENIHVSVHCADYWATPERGLVVSVDGVPQPAHGENGIPLYASTKSGPVMHWVPTDIGYAVEPGVHHIALEAPGCSSLAEDVEADSALPISIAGRLPIADDSLRGTTAAPNGFGVAAGVYIGGRGAHVSTDRILQSSFAYDRITTTGGALTMSFDRRTLAVAFDMTFASGSTTGTATTMSSGPQAFTGSAMAFSDQLRVGARQPFGNVALAAGAGVGGHMWLDHSDTRNNASLPAGDVDVDWYVPLWTSVTYKPACSWGAQVLASYDVHPTSTNENSPSFLAGLLYQPSVACSDRPGLTVR
jgi:hypothetical protein